MRYSVVCGHGFTSNSSSEPQIKRKRLSLALPKNNDLKKVWEGFVPLTTQRCTTWAVHTFETWKNDWNKKCEDRCPDDLFKNASISVLNKWLSAFVIEAQHEDGKRYPATTITNLLSGLWRFAHSKSPDCPNFMDRRDRRFSDPIGALKSFFFVSSERMALALSWSMPL